MLGQLLLICVELGRKLLLEPSLRIDLDVVDYRRGVTVRTVARTGAQKTFDHFDAGVLERVQVFAYDDALDTLLLS